MNTSKKDKLLNINYIFDINNQYSFPLNVLLTTLY